MRERAASQKAKLLKSDGGRLYSDEEHQKREQAIIGEMARVADEVSEEADELAEAKTADLYRHRHGCRTEDLVGPQLEAANARRSFVKEDCEDLPLDEFAKRLRAILTSNEKEMILAGCSAVEPFPSRAHHRLGGFSQRRSCIAEMRMGQ